MTTIGGNHHQLCKKSSTFAPDFKKTNMKDKLNIQLLTAAILSLGGLILLFCGVFIDPQGQISESLLIGFGEVATFAGALFGIDYTYKQKYNAYDHRTNPRKPPRQSGDRNAYTTSNGGKPTDENP